jgi:hypothetical protein
MKQEILDCISKGAVSFVELAREVPGFEGDLQLRLPQKNWVLWSGLSQEAVDALKELMDDNLITQTPCQPITYMVDGGWLDLPLVKTARSYKKPHWIPVTYSLAKQK